MKPAFLIIVGLLFVFLGGQVALAWLFIPASSAGVAPDTVRFQCDFINPFGLLGDSLTLHYMGSSQSQFTRVRMTRLVGDPHYDMTYECGVYFATNPGQVQYYFSGGDSILFTQSPFYTGTQFPPPQYYANFLVDPAGDTVAGTPGAWLDLTGSGMTYSATKIYGYLSNVSQTWPSNHLDTLYIYALGLMDPSQMEPNVYAMAYVNLFPIITPGLYKINLVDTSFTRLGNVSYNISGGRLFMSCNISDLVNDPGWSDWPPEEGYVLSVAMTFSGSLTSLTYHDFTGMTFYEPRCQTLNFASNVSPVIFGPGFEPNPTVFLRTRIGYWDSDNHLPVIKKLYFDRGVYEMGSYDHVYSDSAEFEYYLPWPGEGWHFYYFVFSDGAETVRTAWDSIYLSAVNVAQTSQVPATLALGPNYPNPFNSSTTIEFELPEEMYITLEVFDICGRLVANLEKAEFPAGRHRVTWDARANDGQSLPSGIYFCRLRHAAGEATRCLLLLR